MNKNTKTETTVTAYELGRAYALNTSWDEDEASMVAYRAGELSGDAAERAEFVRGFRSSD